MANKPIGNMIINLSLNSSSFSKTINGIRKQINVAKSAMKANMSILSDAGSEYEKLKAKVNGLNQIMAANEKQIDLLKKKYDQAKKTYGENSKEAQGLAKMLNNAIERQGQYSKQLGQVTSKMKDYQRGTQNLKKELNLVERETNASIKSLQAQGKSYQATASKLAGLQKAQSLQSQIVEKEKEKLKELISEKGKDAQETKAQQAAYAESKAKLSQYEESIGNIKDKYKNIGQESAKFADHLTEIGNKFTKSGEKAKTWGASLSKAFTAPITAIAALGAKFSAQMSTIQGNIRAMTGATTSEAKKQGKIVGQVWADGFGDSTEEVGDAVIKIKQNLKGIDDSQLKSVTEKALTLSKITGADVEESLRGVNSLMTNFGMSANQAFDYMVTGAQRGLNKSGELEDNIAEYGQLWAQNGFSAKEMFGILENGLKTGAYNFDKVNDFVKEFGISLSDGRFEKNLGSFSSKTQELFDKYKAGKATTKDVFESAINDLKGMKNQQEKLTIASTVWSSLGEDNAMKVIQSLNNTNHAYDHVTGAANKASKALSSSPTAKFQTAWRSIQLELKPVGDSLLRLGAAILPKVAGAIKSILSPFQKLSPTMQGVTLGVAAFIASIGPMLLVGGYISGMIGRAITGFRDLRLAMGATSIAGGMLDGVLTVLTSPITLIIAAIAALGAGFVIAYNKSKPFHNFINNLGKSISNVYQKIKQFVSAIIQMFQNNWAGGADLLHKIGLSDASVQKIILTVTKIKSVFQSLKNYIHQALSAIGSFIKKQISGLVNFWKQNGGMITQAVKNVFKVIGIVAKTAFTIIKPIFKLGFMALVIITKSVWNSIKGIISGAIKVIEGIILVFSGLFTGNWRKMWNGVKSIFLGSIKIIWNWFQLVWIGKMLKGAKAFAGPFKSIFSKLWSAIKKIFSSPIKWIVNLVKKGWNSLNKVSNWLSSRLKKVLSLMWNSIKKIFSSPVKWIINLVKKGWSSLSKLSNSLSSGLKKILSSMWNSVKRIFSKPLKWIVNLLKDSWNRITKLSKSLSSGLSKLFRRFWDGLKKIFSAPLKWIVNAVKNGWNNMKNQAVKIAGNMKDKISSVWNKIVSTTKSLPKRMASGIKGGAHTLERAMISVGNAMLRGLGKGVNGVGKGINWILSKVHAPSKVRIPKWHVPQFANGTSDFEGGLAVVGDARKHELISLPNGQSFISPNTDTLVNLPKGTSVLNGDATEELMSMSPHFAFGTGWLEKAWHSIKSAGSKALNFGKSIAHKTSNVGKTIVNKAINVGKSAASKAVSVGKSTISKIAGAGKTIWDYMSHPKKLIDKAVNAFTSFSGLKNPTLSIAKGAVTKVKDNAVNWIKKFFDMGNPPGAGVKRWRPYVVRALEMNGLSSSTGMVNKVLRQIQTESGGNPHAIQHGYTDINTIHGDLAKGLMQTISATFNAYKFPGHGNIFNGFDNLLAALNYAKHRYGRSLSALGQGHGYSNGAIVTKDQIAHIAEGNKPEAIIPLAASKRTRAMRILSETQRILGIPNGSSVTINNDYDEMIDRQDQQISLMQKQIELLTQLLLKDQNIEVDGREIAKATAPYMQTEINVLENRKNRLGGVI